MEAETEVRGTFACPICGKDYPHHHPTMDAYQTAEAGKQMTEMRDKLEMMGRAMEFVEYCVNHGQTARAIWVARGAMRGEYDRATALGMENPTAEQLEAIKAESDSAFALSRMKSALEDIEIGPSCPWLKVAYPGMSFGDACREHAKGTLDHIANCIGLPRSISSTHN